MGPDLNPDVPAICAGKAYLMTGPWELDPTGRTPGIYMDDPAGGDPICLCTISRLHHPELLVEALSGAKAVIAYHAAICSPKGVVPDDSLYDPVMAAAIQAAMDAGIPLRSSAHLLKEKQP